MTTFPEFAADTWGSSDMETEEQNSFEAEHANFVRARIQSFIMRNRGPETVMKFHTREFWVKERYLLLRVIERAILSAGAKIFGGYLRDMILHHQGAKNFFDSDEVLADPSKKSSYADPNVHPSSFKDRNTYPNDIDCFVETEGKVDDVVQKIKDTISSVKVVHVSSNSCYTHHPEFSLYYGCKRIVFQYAFNSSLQKLGEQIEIPLDIVFSLNKGHGPPWRHLIDSACNMLWCDEYSGMHTAFEDTNDVVENAFRLVSLIEMIKSRVTFVPPMTLKYRMCSMNQEIQNLIRTRKFNEIQAVGAWRKYCKSYRSLYRFKYLERIAKLVRSGWTITNLPIKFAISNGQQQHGESICAISHEDIQAEGQLLVTLGVMTNAPPFNPSFTQTSVLTWNAFVQYMFSGLPRIEDCFSNERQWSIVCPISKNPVDTTENRPIGVVIREASRFLKAEQLDSQSRSS